jgi:hypothetical protein
MAAQRMMEAHIKWLSPLHKIIIKIKKESRQGIETASPFTPFYLGRHSPSSFLSHHFMKYQKSQSKNGLE